MLLQDPGSPPLLLSLAQIHSGVGRYRESLTVLQRCLEIAPHAVPVLMHASWVAMQVGDMDQAVALAQRAAAGQPNDVAIQRHLAACWDRVGDPLKALDCLNRALHLAPGAVDLLVQRLLMLITLGRHDESVAAAQRVLAVPSQKHSILALTTLIRDASQQSDWEELAPLTARLEAAVRQPGANCNPSLLSATLDDPDAVIHTGRVQERIVPPGFDRAALRAKVGGRLVIGYYTADVGNHPVAQMLLSVLEQHDREHFRFVLIRLRPDDGSAMSTRVGGMFDAEIDIHRMTDQQAAAAIREAGIDVLVDLMGITLGNRIELLAQHPSPVQVLWLGCAITTGRGIYDAFLVDAMICPAGFERFCSEPLHRLPLCYHPISIGDPGGSTTLDRHQCGLPDDGLVVGLFVTDNRVRPPFIEQLVRCLAPHPKVHFWLRARQDVQARVRGLLGRWGLPAERVHFLPRFPERADYLRAQRLVDLMVDSHPYGGHSTTGEALSQGVPVLCRRGASIASRVGASMMQTLGLGDLVAGSSAEQFAQLTRLLTSAEELAAWKRRFAAAATEPPIERHRRLAAALEDAYRVRFEQVADDRPATVADVRDPTGRQ